MKLGDLLFVTSEHITINIFDYEGNRISYYNGKDSIEVELNDRMVITQYVQNNELCVIVL